MSILGLMKGLRCVLEVKAEEGERSQERRQEVTPMDSCQKCCSADKAKAGLCSPRGRRKENSSCIKSQTGMISMKTSGQEVDEEEVAEGSVFVFVIVLGRPSCF